MFPLNTLKFLWSFRWFSQINFPPRTHIIIWYTVRQFNWHIVHFSISLTIVSMHLHPHPHLDTLKCLAKDQKREKHKENFRRREFTRAINKNAKEKQGNKSKKENWKMEKMRKGKGKTKRQTLRPFCGHGRRRRVRLALGIFATGHLRS